MSIDLYIDYFSQPSRAVLAFCIEAKIPFKIKLIRLANGDNLKEEFFKISPWGNVPVIVHNGKSYYESHAIMCYLADVFNVDESWYPKTPEKRIIIDMYLHWHHENIRGNFAGYIFNKFFGPKFFGMKFSQEFNDICITRQRAVLEYIDQILATKYIAGTEKPSIGDLSCYCELTQMAIDNFDFTPYKNVSKWMSNMKKISGVAQAHKVFDNLLPKVKI